MNFLNNNMSSVSVARIYLGYDNLEIISVNEEFERIVGFSQEELVERRMHFYDLVPKKQQARMREVIEIQLSTMDKVLMAHDLCDREGVLHPVAGVGQHYYDELIGTDVVEVLFVRADICQREDDERIYDADFFRKIFSQLGFGVVMFRVTQGRIVPEYFTDTFYEMIQTTPQQVRQIRDYTSIFHEDDVSRFKADVLKCVSVNDKIIGEYRIKRITGGYDWYQVRMALFEYHNGVPVIITTFVNVNISKHNELEMRLQNEMLTALIEDKKEQLIKYDVDEDLLSVSSVMRGVLTESYTVPRYVATLHNNARIYKEDKELFYNAITACSKTATRMEFDVRMRVFSGEYLWHRINLVSAADAVGNVQKVYGRLSEIHQEKMKQEQLKNMAERDSLTGLYNHSAYIGYVDSAIEKNRESGKKCALFMLDLDDFKLINDMLGHAAGDELLSVTAERMKEFMGTDCFAGRIGGDEFSVFVGSLDNDEQAAAFASKLHSRLGQKAVRGRHSVSMGYEVSDYKKASFNLLYQYADQALYDVKRSGKNQFKKYEPDTENTKSTQAGEADSYIAGEGWILEKIEEPVYVCDANTYEVLYANKHLKKIFGRDDNWDWHKKLCYEAIWDRESKCEDCHMEILEDRNNTLCDLCGKNPNFLKIERIIRFKNRKAKLTTFFDTRDKETIAKALRDRVETEDTLFACLANMSTASVKSSHRYLNVLKNLGEYYSADQASLFEYDENGMVADYHDWCRDMAHNISTVIEGLGREKFIELVSPFMNENNIVIIENLRQAQKCEELCQLMENHRIWSVYGIPLKNENKNFGILVLFNLKKDTGKLRLLYMVGESLSNEMLRERLWNRQLFDMYHDSLTGLCNRAYYNEMLKEAKELKSVGVLFADANDIAKYNDDFGFEAGNRLLVELADVFKKYFGRYKVFRFDSDDFVVCCENISRDEFIRLVSGFKEEIAKHGNGVSCGFVWDDYHMDIRKLYSHAEEMMETVKEKYHQQSDKAGQSKAGSVFGDVKRLLEKGNFRVYLQPKINLITGELCGVEALIRLYMPHYGIIAPGSFVDLLERAGAIELVDLYVFEEICKMFVQWKEKNMRMIPVSFNFSRKTLMSPTIFESVAAILSKYDVPKEYLEIEVTESIGDMEYDAITQIAGKFHNMGFSLAMDDFGTKYSSIAILSHMNFDTMKIDRSMVNNLEDNDISRKVLKHVVLMCRDLGIQCVAEGVENERQAEILKELECTMAQGYLYDKPLPVEEFNSKYMLHN